MMKRENEWQELLGLKQEEIAMILKISRTQWSMFVLGKRDLPADKKIKLSEILNYINLAVATQKLDAKDLNHASKRLKIFEYQKKDNQFQQMKLERKLKTTEKKYKRARVAILLIDFLETKSQKPSTHEQVLLNLIQINALKIIAENSLVLQEQLQLQFKTLQYEAMLIEKKIKS